MKKRPTPCYRDTNPCIAGIALIVAAASLGGCGGGGGGGDSVVSSAAPTATPSAVSTTEDVPISGTLTASDPDGDPMTYSIASQPSMGSTVITDPLTGSFTYTPNPDENGTDNFSFIANDGSFDSNTADVTITITSDNDAPMAQPGTLTTDEDTPADGTLTASDPDGDPLTYSIASAPSMGSAVITDTAAGTFTYRPDPDQSGQDSFTFSATDGSSFSNSETVTVNITAVNDAPVATGQCGTTPQANTFSSTLTATDPETPALLMYSLNADGSGGADPITTVKGGTVTITDQTTGAFTYQPDTSAGDKRGEDSFAYQVIDPDGATDNATETVIVDQTIMPLGDSITTGTIDVGPGLQVDSQRVGYRKPLYDALIASGITFDFVGSQEHGWDLFDDVQNEGHGGWTAFDLAWGQNPPTDGVFVWLDLNPADIILLHAGTNDLSNTDENDIADILNEIDRWENSAGGNPVTVILALIIDQDPINPAVQPLNDSVRDMIENPSNPLFRGNDDIILVNQHDALIYPDDLWDQLHPNNTGGYTKMGDVWFNVLSQRHPQTLENLIDSCP